MGTLTDREYRRNFYRAVGQRQAADPRQREYYVPIYDQPAMQPYDVVGTLKDGIEFSAASGHRSSQSQGVLTRR